MANYSGYSTSKEFDLGYDNFITPDVVAHWTNIYRRDSDAALELRKPDELRFGSKSRNAIDFFPAENSAAAAPTLVAIHGGLWFLFDKWFMHFLARAFTARGVNVACINYGLAPDQSLGGIVDDCRQAVAFLYRNAKALSIESSRISVLGHSAAGQLAAMVAAAPWDTVLPKCPAQILHSCVGVSGFYDIEPFAQTHFHQFTQFPPEEYFKWNPLRNASANFPSTLLITGEKESSLLQQMTQHFAAALQAHHVPVETFCAPGEDHFSVLHEIGSEKSALFSKVLHAIL